MISVSSLSEGEKQQISIARAIVRKAPILVLDEATSSVDMRMERMIVGAIKRMAEGRTSFVVAHRLSTVRDADVIMVIEGGTPNELMGRDSYYRSLNATA